MPEQDDGEIQQNHLECGCPNCDRAIMGEQPVCIKCYTENCNPTNVYDDGRAKCQ